MVGHRVPFRLNNASEASQGPNTKALVPQPAPRPQPMRHACEANVTDVFVPGATLDQTGESPVAERGCPKPDAADGREVGASPGMEQSQRAQRCNSAPQRVACGASTSS